jgi:DNA-binding transcriptional LysR family regulator
MDQDVELRHLRYFVAVAEELHFGRAALRLHLAQPPLSQQIRKLEEILGHALFTRTTRAVKLTSAGEIFLDSARRTLQRVQEDLDEARSVGRGEVGFLRVGFTGSSMLTPLPSMLSRYRKQYPKVSLQLHESHTAFIVQNLIKGTLDAGFLRDGGPTDGLDVETLFTEPFVAVVPADHPLATRSSITAGDLRDEPFVFFSPTAGKLAYDKHVSLCEAYGFRPRVVQEAPQWLTIMGLIGAGLGVSIAPACVQQIAASDVVCIRLRGTNIRSNVELASRAQDDRAIIKSFAHIARRSFANSKPLKPRRRQTTSKP